MRISADNPYPVAPLPIKGLQSTGPDSVQYSFKGVFFEGKLWSLWIIMTLDAGHTNSPKYDQDQQQWQAAANCPSLIRANALLKKKHYISLSPRAEQGHSLSRESRNISKTTVENEKALSWKIPSTNPTRNPPKAESESQEKETNQPQKLIKNQKSWMKQAKKRGTTGRAINPYPSM